MKSLVFLEPGKLAWRDVPDAVITAPDDVIVRPIAATTCDIDKYIIDGSAPMRGPFCLGHEAVGEVVEIGCDVRKRYVGERVVMTYFHACGTCQRCHNHAPNRCSEHPKEWMGVGLPGMEGVGSFAELVRVPHADFALVPLPDHFDPVDVASAGDNIPFGYELVVPHLQRNPGANVLIMGGVGSIPLYATAFAFAAGASTVDYADTDPEALRIAAELGATVHQGPPPRRMGRYGITVDASGTESGLLCAIRSTADEGFCSSVGAHFRDFALPLWEMYAQGIHFYTGPGRGLPNILPALDLVSTHRIPIGMITSSVHPFASADTVLLTPERKPVFVR